MDKKVFSLALLVVLFSGFSIAQTTNNATPPLKPLKERILHDWKYEGSEQFGAFTPADSVKYANDMISFDANGVYTMIFLGVSTSGKYSINEDYRQLYLTDGKTGGQTMYTIKKLNDTFLILNYQTPDLVNTKYKYRVK